MGHYDCPKCHQLHCTCPQTPLHKPPDDGLHWKSNGAAFNKCVNCGMAHYFHIGRFGDKCQIIPAKPKPLTEERIRGIAQEFWGTAARVKAFEDAHVAFARLIEKEIKDAGS